MKAGRVRDHIPLLHILMKLSPEERQIIISHLNDSTCAQIELCMAKVLRGRKKINLSAQEELKNCVKENQSKLNKLFAARSSAGKRKALTQVGGKLYATLFGAGLPLLLNTLKK